MSKGKVVTDISDRRMVGRKVRVELEGPKGKDGDGPKINGYVVAQYIDNTEPEETTILRVAVVGPIT